MAIFKHLYSLILLSFLFTLVSSNPVALPKPAQTQDPPGAGLTWEVSGSSPNTIACETHRTSDYYGLGVRLGVYMAWLSGWIANVSVPDEMAGALDTNAIFLFALVIAMVRCTITDLVSRIDGLMLMHLSLGTVFSSISVWGYRSCVYVREGPGAIKYFGGFGTHLRLWLSMAVSVYGFWFWMFGVTGSLQTGPAPCNFVFTFFFTKLRVHNTGIRIAYLVLFISCMVYFGIMTLVGFLGLVTRVCKMRWLAKYRFLRTSSRLKYATGFSYGQLKMLFRVLATFNLFWIVFTIIICEYTLQYNNIQSVLGENGRIFFPSQLIPFAIGTCGLIRVMYLYFESWRSSDHTPSLSRAPTMPKHATAVPQSPKGVFKMFAPATKTEEDGTAKKLHFEDGDLDEEMLRRGVAWRMLVSWLPWLQAASIWWKGQKQPWAEPFDQKSKDAEAEGTKNDVQRGESSSDDKRRTWGTENTLHMNRVEEEERTEQSRRKHLDGSD